MLHTISADTHASMCASGFSATSAYPPSDSDSWLPRARMVGLGWDGGQGSCPSMENNVSLDGKVSFLAFLGILNSEAA